MRYKNNGALNPGTDENSRIRQMPNGNLFISPVETSDEAVYKCHAANDLGEASSTGNLTVLCKDFKSCISSLLFYNIRIDGPEFDKIELYLNHK